MSRYKAALAASLFLVSLAVLGGCASLQQPQERASYQRRPVSFSPQAARDWLTTYRESKGLPAVRIDPKLTAFAQDQADAMASRNELSHTVGGSFASRVKAAGLSNSRIGENVSYGTYTDADAMRQWKNSPGHNENLLLPGATRFGIAIAQTGGRVYWAMAIAGEPVRERRIETLSQGPLVRRKVPSNQGGILSIFGIGG